MMFTKREVWAVTKLLGSCTMARAPLFTQGLGLGLLWLCRAVKCNKFTASRGSSVGSMQCLHQRSYQAVQGRNVHQQSYTMNGCPMCAHCFCLCLSAVQSPASAWFHAIVTM